LGLGLIPKQSENNSTTTLNNEESYHLSWGVRSHPPSDQLLLHQNIGWVWIHRAVQSFSTSSNIFLAPSDHSSQESSLGYFYRCHWYLLRNRYNFHHSQTHSISACTLQWICRWFPQFLIQSNSYTLALNVTSVSIFRDSRHQRTYPFEVNRITYWILNSLI
jgi:hypothetical protein